MMKKIIAIVALTVSAGAFAVNFDNANGSTSGNQAGNADVAGNASGEGEANFSMNFKGKGKGDADFKGDADNNTNYQGNAHGAPSGYYAPPPPRPANQ